MEEMDFETGIKVIIVGNGQVGKTSMITQYATGSYTVDYKKTIGTDFMEKDLDLSPDYGAVKLMLWDTAGQEMFGEITRNYYRGADVVLYVFSTIDRASFVAIEKWVQKVTAVVGIDSTVNLLVQNKVDLLDNTAVSKDEAECLARNLQMRLYRTCVKENMHIDQLFEDAARSYMEKTRRIVDTVIGPENPSKVPDDIVDLNDTQPQTQRTGGKKSFCKIFKFL